MNTPQKNLNEHLTILERAISDTGYWSYWGEQFPDLFLLEFSMVQLWNPPAQEGNPPSSKIALAFPHPLSVNFLTYSHNNTMPKNWPELMAKDELPLPQGVFVTFQDQERMKEELQHAHSINTAFGFSCMEEERFFATEYQFFARAGNIGVAVCCNEAPTLRNAAGEVLSLEEAKEKNEKWWEYWKEYWKQKNADNPMPEDATCEVTIPTADEK